MRSEILLATDSRKALNNLTAIGVVLTHGFNDGADSLTGPDTLGGQTIAFAAAA